MPNIRTTNVKLRQTTNIKQQISESDVRSQKSYFSPPPPPPPPPPHFQAPPDLAYSRGHISKNVISNLVVYSLLAFPW